MYRTTNKIRFFTFLSFVFLFTIFQVKIVAMEPTPGQEEQQEEVLRSLAELRLIPRPTSAPSQENSTLRRMHRARRHTLAPTQLLDTPVFKVHNFTWIISELIGAMRRPIHPKILPALSSLNVGLVVTLLEQDLPEVYNNFQGIARLHLPTPTGQPPSLEHFQLFLATARRIEHNHQAIVVHCENGQSRTGSLIAAYLVLKNNFTANDAIDKIREIRGPESIDTPAQEAFVHYVENNKREFTLD